MEADQEAYKVPRWTLGRLFGLSRKQVARSRVRLDSTGLTTAQVARDHRTTFTVHAEVLAATLGRSVSVNSDCAPGHFGPTIEETERLAGMVQIVPVNSDCAPGQFEPLRVGAAFDLPPFAAWSRIALICRNRDEAILVAWLYQCGAHLTGVVATTRQIESRLLSLVARCTVMRAMARLSDAGLVRIEPLGREGARYHLNAAAVLSLLATFPFHEDAATVLPGWSNLDFPLLSRIASSLAATPSASSSHVAQADDPASAAIASLEAQT
jgi:DNA-binding transcriptional ArsR family regulator